MWWWCNFQQIAEENIGRAPFLNVNDPSVFARNLITYIDTTAPLGCLDYHYPPKGSIFKGEMRGGIIGVCGCGTGDYSVEGDACCISLPDILC